MQNRALLVLLADRAFVLSMCGVVLSVACDRHEATSGPLPSSPREARLAPIPSPRPNTSSTAADMPSTDEESAEDRFASAAEERSMGAELAALTATLARGDAAEGPDAPFIVSTIRQVLTPDDSVVVRVVPGVPRHVVALVRYGRSGRRANLELSRANVEVARLLEVIDEDYEAGDDHIAVAIRASSSYRAMVVRRPRARPEYCVGVRSYTELEDLLAAPPSREPVRTIRLGVPQRGTFARAPHSRPLLWVHSIRAACGADKPHDRSSGGGLRSLRRIPAGSRVLDASPTHPTRRRRVRRRCVLRFRACTQCGRGTWRVVRAEAVRARCGWLHDPARPRSRRWSRDARRRPLYAGCPLVIEATTKPTTGGLVAAISGVQRSPTVSPPRSFASGQIGAVAPSFVPLDGSPR